jgi:hypothetical protein
LPVAAAAALLLMLELQEPLHLLLPLLRVTKI